MPGREGHRPPRGVLGDLSHVPQKRRLPEPRTEPLVRLPRPPRQVVPWLEPVLKLEVRIPRGLGGEPGGAQALRRNRAEIPARGRGMKNRLGESRSESGRT